MIGDVICGSLRCKTVSKMIVSFFRLHAVQIKILAHFFQCGTYLKGYYIYPLFSFLYSFLVLVFILYYTRRNTTSITCVYKRHLLQPSPQLSFGKPQPTSLMRPSIMPIKRLFARMKRAFVFPLIKISD